MEKDWKQVFLTGQEYQAEMAKEILANIGINAVVINQQDGAFLNITGKIGVYVHEDNVAEANEILKQLKH